MIDAKSSLHPSIAAAFYGSFQSLRPMQAAAIQPLIKGRNIVLSSGTGSGKTEAVTAPLLSNFWIEALKEDRTVMLYIAPTKALINDIAKRLEQILQPLSLHVGIRHSDHNDLNRATKPHVLITTPESLNVMLRRKEPILAQVRCVVIDEIHLLFNTQRGLHLAILLSRLRRFVGAPLQWAALSATMGNLPGVCEFFFGPEERADFLQFPTTRTIEAQIRVVQNTLELRKLFVRLMDAPRRKLLVFTNSRKDCESFAGELQRAPELASIVFTHHSSLSKDLREQTERQFAEAPCAICVATSTLEIGIDIGDIDAVILMGIPPDIASFLQRIGRGNRRCSKSNVICLCQPGSGALREALVFASLLKIGREGRMPKAGAQRLWGAVAQQCLSIIQQEEGAYTPIADLAAEVGALPYIDRSSVEKILAELASAELLQKHGFKNRYGAADGLWQMEDDKMLFANFPLSSQTIDLRNRQQLLGSIPRYNLMKIKQGTKVRFAGRVWLVRLLDPTFVEVEPSVNSGSVVDLSYDGMGRGSLDSFHAQTLRHAIFAIDESSSCMFRPVWAEIEPLIDMIRNQISNDSLPYERTPIGVRYFTFAGDLANKVIAKWFGGGVRAETDCTIISPYVLDWTQLPTKPGDLLPQAELVFSPSTSQTIFQQRLPVEMQREEWLQEWIQDQSVAAVLERLQIAEPQSIASGTLDWLLPPAP